MAVRSLIVLLCLYFSWCFGQPAVVNRRAMMISGLASAAPWTPFQLGLSHWWVFTDVNTNNYKTNVWFDRIAAMPVLQSDTSKQPTNTASGYRFRGTYFVSTNTTPARTVVFVILSFTDLQNFQYPLAWGSGGWGLTQNSGTPSFGWTGTPIGSLFANRPATNAWVDAMLVTCVSPTNGTYYYTNGALVVTSTATNTMNDILVFGARRNDGLQPFYGYIKEILMATNLYTDNGALVASQLHQYATNTYGYSP